MRRLACALMLFALRASAEQTAITTVVVPVVGSAIGPGPSQWKTDLELHNDLRTEATVTISLPVVADQPILLFTIPPHGVQRFADVVGEAFALDNVLSPLVVQTLGGRSVRVVATAYSIQGTAISAPQPIPVMSASSFLPTRSLIGVSWSDSRRTNIGLVNLGDREAVFSIALRGENGETIAASRTVLPENAMWHMAVQLVFPAMRQGDNYTVVVETGSRDTYVYGSVIENNTNEARFLAPTVGVR